MRFQARVLACDPDDDVGREVVTAGLVVALGYLTLPPGPRLRALALTVVLAFVVTLGIPLGLPGTSGQALARLSLPLSVMLWGAVAHAAWRVSMAGAEWVAAGRARGWGLSQRSMLYPGARNSAGLRPGHTGQHSALYPNRRNSAQRWPDAPGQRPALQPAAGNSAGIWPGTTTARGRRRNRAPVTALGAGRASGVDCRR